MVEKVDNIEEIEFGEAISERYISYALSTIMSRSLPDVRDGLKPVHRRLLYAMMKLKLDPDSGYKKCARVVGDVIGKYHPHGDVAVYDTLARLAQDFSLRYPLIDGQGNFGSIDGDNAAAMRYTESRMTEICTLLMEDINKDTVNFCPTYDNSDQEPELMPTKFPNLLANGTEGIAVGMATSVPPHNLHEICEALIYLIDNPEKANCHEVMQFIEGPDFPTGGIVIDNREAINNSYATGRGSFRLRAKWEKENFSHGLYQIVITEIPYQVQKSKLIEKIAELLKDKKIPLINNIRDESSENIRIIIEPKVRNSSPEMIMESLFKQCPLQVRINLNMNVLSSNSVPKVMNILEVLQEFVAHRQEVITRRTRFSINKIDARLEILAALKLVYLNIDKVIQIIREEDEPKKMLIGRFNINDVQAEAILNLKLRALRKLEENQINTEHSNLTKEHQSLSKILDCPNELCRVIKGELREIKKKFGKNTEIGSRRTLFNQLEDVAPIIDISAFIEKEPVTVICSKMGWIRSLKGHNLDLANIKYKEGDEKKYVVETYTTDSIIICTTSGKFFTILSDNIIKGKGHGESIRLMVDMENYDITNIFSYKKEQKFIVASDDSRGFIVNSDDLLSSTKGGKQILNIASGSKCNICTAINGNMLAAIGTNRKLLVFSIDELPVMKRGRGVIIQKYRDGKLSDIKVFDENQGLSWLLGRKNRSEKNIMMWRAKRTSSGKIPPIGFPRDNKFH